MLDSFLEEGTSLKDFKSLFIPNLMIYYQIFLTFSGILEIILDFQKYKKNILAHYYSEYFGCVWWFVKPGLLVFQKVSKKTKSLSTVHKYKIFAGWASLHVFYREWNCTRIWFITCVIKKRRRGNFIQICRSNAKIIVAQYVSIFLKEKTRKASLVAR